MTADEPTAIRVWHYRGAPGTWHRPLPDDDWETPCDLFAMSMTERVPLSQTAPEDRCRTCWPTTKETR